MDKILLSAKTRESKGKKMRAEAENNIPAVIYGQGAEAQHVWVDATEFSRAFSAGGTNTVVSLTVDDAKKPLDILIYDFQTNPTTDVFTHVDFYLVNMKEEVEAAIPVVFTGIAPAVKELGGTLVTSYDSVNVRALPGDLPHEIEMDLSVLATFDDSIVAGDIKVNGKVELLVEDDVVIASVSAPRSEEEMAALDEEVDADVSKIEGVADKDEEGGEAAEEAEEKKE